MNRVIAGLLIGCLSSVTYGGGDARFKEAMALYTSQPERAFPLLLLSAENGNASAMVGTGFCLETATGTTVNFAGAITWYEKAVAQNNLKACEGLARIYASCPEPEFHHGEKALKYAKALVRKNPGDTGFMRLLAAAYARDVQFDKAESIADKAMRKEHRTREKEALKKMRDQYRVGVPYPAIATDLWLLSAADQGSPWAIACAVERMGDHFDSLCNPELAILLCEKGIHKGHVGLYPFMATSYYNQGDLRKYNEFYDKWRTRGDTTKLEQAFYDQVSFPVEIRSSGVFSQREESLVQDAARQMHWQDVFNVSGTISHYKYDSGASRTGSYVYDFERKNKIWELYYSEDELKKKYPKWVRGTYEIKNDPPDGSKMMNDNKHYDLTVYKFRRPPEIDVARLMLEVAAEKGNAEAQKQIRSFDQKINHYRELLKNEENLDSEVLTSALNQEALKFCNNDVLPVNIPLVERLYRTSYNLQPSGRTACLLGMVYLRDYLTANRSLDLGIHWLKVAHAEGYLPATRRLVLLYACDADPDVWDAKQALYYANKYAEDRPLGDPDALYILACAHAGKGEFNEAQRLITQAIELQKETKTVFGLSYQTKLRAYKERTPSLQGYRSSEERTFATYARHLEEI